MTDTTTEHSEPAQPAGVPAERPVRPVAAVERDGATVRLKWASVEAAHNAVIGPLYDQRALAAADREWYGKLEAADAEVARMTAEIQALRSMAEECADRGDVFAQRVLLALGPN